MILSMFMRNGGMIRVSRMRIRSLMIGRMSRAKQVERLRIGGQYRRGQLRRDGGGKQNPEAVAQQAHALPQTRESGGITLRIGKAG